MPYIHNGFSSDIKLRILLYLHVDIIFQDFANWFGGMRLTTRSEFA